MKSIENKLTDINQADENGQLMGKADYGNLITICLKQGKQGGFDYDDITMRSEISKAIEAAKATTGEAEPLTINLENAPFLYLQKLIAQARWGFWHQDILPFKDYIASIK